MEVDIDIVEDAEKDNLFGWLIKWFLDDEITVTSVDDMVTKIEARLGDDDCLRNLTLYGHGAPGLMCVGIGMGDLSQNPELNRQSINTRNTAIWKPLLDRLKGRFCDDALVTLYGCNTGAYAGGACILEDISKCLNVKARANTGAVSPWGQEGEWVVADGSKPDPRDPPPKSRPKKQRAGSPGTGTRAVSYVADGRPRQLDLERIDGFSYREGFADVGRQASTDRLSPPQSRAIQRGLEAEPVSIVDEAYAIQGRLQPHAAGGRGMESWAVVDDFRLVVPGDDWSHAYSLSDEAAGLLRERTPFFSYG